MWSIMWPLGLIILLCPRLFLLLMLLPRLASLNLETRHTEGNSIHYSHDSLVWAPSELVRLSGRDTRWQQRAAAKLKSTVGRLERIQIGNLSSSWRWPT